MEDAHSNPNAPFCPTTKSYAVIRMDPVAMVEHLNDAEAFASARALRPKFYVVYIDCDHSLPFPGVPWYGFSAHMVAPLPPPEDEEQGMSPDMCIAIHPNAATPQGRPPLVTHSPSSFPYTNCYHWPDMALDIRVIARPEGFDRSKTAKLPARESMKLSRYLAEDGAKRWTTLEARAASMGVSTATGIDTNQKIDLRDRAPSGDHLEETTDTVNDDDQSIRTFTSRSGYSDSLSDSAQSGDLDDGFFGDPTQNVEIFPLVHLWVDMAAQLPQDEIADPREMFEERDAIVRIIDAARARNPLLPPLLPPIPAIFKDYEDVVDDEVDDPMDACSMASSHDVDNHDDNRSLASESAKLGKDEELRPSKVLHQAIASIRRIFRLPYLPVWP